MTSGYTTDFSDRIARENASKHLTNQLSRGLCVHESRRKSLALGIARVHRYGIAGAKGQRA